MSILSKQQLYVAFLQNAYQDDMQFIDAIDLFGQTAVNDKLIQYFHKLRDPSVRQLGRLRHAFKMLGETDFGQPVTVFRLMIDTLLQTTSSSPEGIRDLAFMAVTRKMEYCRTANYEVVCHFARELGFENQAVALQTTLIEISASKQALTEMAERPLHLTICAA